MSFVIGKESFKVTSTFKVKEQKVGIYFNAGDTQFLTQDKLDVLVCPEATRFELYETQDHLNNLVALSAKFETKVVATNLVGCESGADIFDG